MVEKTRQWKHQYEVAEQRRAQEKVILEVLNLQNVEPQELLTKR